MGKPLRPGEARIVMPSINPLASPRGYAKRTAWEQLQAARHRSQLAQSLFYGLLGGTLLTAFIFSLAHLLPALLIYSGLPAHMRAEAHFPGGWAVASVFELTTGVWLLAKSAVATS